MKFLSQINVNTEYTLPIVDGTNGQVLSTDGQGVAYWGTISAGSLTLDGLSDVVITSPALGQILRYGIPVGSSDANPVWHNFTHNFVTAGSAVTITGAQTITGSKTFTAPTSMSIASGNDTALTITKGGSGEALYVNKTSGSGNAVTVIGTLNATNLVRNGGTSSQFLKADGSVDTSTYLTSLPAHNHDDRYYTETESDSRFYLATNPSGYITGISFANVSSKPTTIAGYGITDAITTTNIGNQSVSFANVSSRVIDSQSTRITAPEGASSVNNSSGTSGAIRIQLPTAVYNNNTMMSMTVHVYLYATGQSFTLRIGGYNYLDGNWYNVFASILSDSGKSLNVPVYFGNNGVDRNVIWIGDSNSSWEYPNVFVTDFQVGHSQNSAWAKGWDVSFSEAEQTNVSASRIAYRQIDAGNIGSYALTSLPAHTHTISNVTNLQTALDGKVPTTRTITINGTTLDLSANRSFTVSSADGYISDVQLGEEGLLKFAGEGSAFTGEIDLSTLPFQPVGSYLTSIPAHTHTISDVTGLQTALDGKLSSDSDSEQDIGGRHFRFNNGINRINIDPRWNESGYDADLGVFHMYSTTAAGVPWGRTGIALYSGSAYQYLTTKAGTTGIFLNNQEIIHSGNIGSQSVAYATSAGTSTNLIGLGSIQSTSVGTSYTVNYQVRENSGGGNNTNEIYAPQLAFHWSGVVASSIMMEASGRIAIRNNPGGSYENFAAAVITATGGNSTQWNTAYGWGDHAAANYASEDFVTSQGYITGYTETDTLASVTGRGASTTTDLRFNGTLTMGTGGTQYIRMGRFPGSTVNTGEAWIGRASDRNTGTMTVQLGGNSASGRSFEVVDYAWSVVLFSVDSSGNLTTYGTITENSSIRYKKDVVDIESTSSKVQLLRPVKYKKIENDSEEIGLIAEDVAELFPEVVKYDDEGRPDGVNYSRLSVILLKAVQELTERVNKLENK